MGIRRGRKRSGAVATVSVHVRELAQLFNSLDPSPFWDRDLDRGAANFIEEEFVDKQSAKVWHLHVHTQQDSATASELQEAVENYYTRLAGTTRREIREHLQLGQLALLGGLTIFLLSMGARQLLQNAVDVLPRALDEGLIVLAWIALWRPTELLVYDWVPLLRRRRLYERLAGIRVLVRGAHSFPKDATPPSAATEREKVS
jgi:hypothetical protein